MTDELAAIELLRSEVLTDTVSYNVSAQIRESILQLEQKREEKQILFNLDLVDCRISGSQDLLKQVWINLIDNAIKFSAPGGKISIHIGCNDRSFFFRISDNGIGIIQQTQEKMFNQS